MNEKEKYIGITFGPITRVTGSVKSTKALWASSFFFSYLAREIIKNFKKREFVYPLVNDELIDKRDGIGNFPDRYIFKSESGDFDKLEKYIEDVIEKVSEGVALNIEKSPEDVKIFLKNYIKIYAFEKEPSQPKENEIMNIPKEFNKLFDLLEAQDYYNYEEKENYLVRFFEDKKLYNSFLTDAAFNDKTYFTALDNIANAEYSLNTVVKPMAYHNYIVIIKSDGDNMTNTIKSLLDEGKSVQELSKALAEFGNNVSKIVKQYGARLIFLGGDDVLIFAPVKYGTVTFFDLIQNLNLCFDRCFNSQIECADKCIFADKCFCNSKGTEFSSTPTLSLGVAITYYKHPMGETLELAEDLLKKAKSNFGKSKNGLACQLQKHSGQTSFFSMKKDWDSYLMALNLVNMFIGCSEKTLSSLTHWIARNEQMLCLILEGLRASDRIKAYFDNSLDEDIHLIKSDFLTAIQEFILSVYKDSQNAQTTITITISLLRIIHFINTKNDD